MQGSTSGNKEKELERIEIELLLEGIYRHYGYDFRNYAYPSICRRVRHRLQAERLSTISSLTEKVLHHPAYMDRLLDDFSINVTEMFRDPSFFLAMRQKVLPQLCDQPVIRIWHAGCSTGEEVYAMAILLHEAGLGAKTMIYATDMNGKATAQAEKGVFPLEKMKQYTKNYHQSGGKREFSEYYSVHGNYVVFHPDLSHHMVFSQHNLVTDHSFNAFDIIICRNVLIYFNEALQRRVLQLFNESLVSRGFLGLGSREGIFSFVRSGLYEEFVRGDRIYRKIL